MTTPVPITESLAAAAHAAAIAHGFEPDFPADVVEQASRVANQPARAPSSPRDLRDWLWSSIDNVESRDLDQVEYVVQQPDGSIALYIGIADVAAFVTKDTPVDRHAAANTASLYLGVQIFPMLPPVLSEGASSLLPGQVRAAHVVEVIIAPNGNVAPGESFSALLTNKAKLDYESVGAWFEGHGPPPAIVGDNAALTAQLQLQLEAAKRLRTFRRVAGSLNIESIEPRTVVSGDGVHVVAVERNPARDLIEDFMIAANTVMAELLVRGGSSSIRRVVREPKRWDGIVALAADMGETLPATPDGKALSAFLTKRRAADPEHFPDLSLAVVKMLGPGEYVLERKGEDNPADSHFGLAVADYVHSTAPNRRFVDLVTLRLAQALERGAPAPYTDDELAAIARHCTEREHEANALEREMRKRIAAAALMGRIGEEFTAIVTGKTPKGVFVRIQHPPAEGLLTRGGSQVEVGNTVRVRLVHADPEKGYVDFAVDSPDDLARKLERATRKRRAAELLRAHVGEQFDAVVTGSGPAGVWVRLLNPPSGVTYAEGKVTEGAGVSPVGTHLRVRLLRANSVRGFIDFAVV